MEEEFKEHTSDYKVFNQKVLDSLDVLDRRTIRIEEQARQTNGRLLVAERDIINLENSFSNILQDYTKAFNLISALNGKFEKVKTDKEIRTEKYIEKVEKEIEDLRKKNRKLLWQVIGGIVIVLLIVMAYVGLINSVVISPIT
jgi:chromosome segregation ATPase